MLKKSKIIGLPVVKMPESVRIGAVSGVDVDMMGKKLLGLYYERTSWMRSSWRVSFEDILLIGASSVLIARYGERKKRATETDVRVMSSNSEHMGRLHDIGITETNGALQAVEIASGFWDDVKYGRHWAKNFAAMEFSEDLVVFSDSLEEDGQTNEERGESKS